jgi:hypothetical protein
MDNGRLICTVCKSAIHCKCECGKFPKKRKAIRARIERKQRELARVYLRFQRLMEDLKSDLNKI